MDLWVSFSTAGGKDQEKKCLAWLPTLRRVIYFFLQLALARSRGGARDTQPPLGPNSFIFCYIQVPEQFKSSKLINYRNKSKSYLFFVSFIVVFTEYKFLEQLHTQIFTLICS